MLAKGVQDSRGRRLQKFIQELQRRNVFRIASIYAVGGWLLMQLAVVLETTLLLPGWFDTLITILVLIGFPIDVLGAWAFEMTPSGSTWSSLPPRPCSWW